MNVNATEFVPAGQSARTKRRGRGEISRPNFTAAQSSTDTERPRREALCAYYISSGKCPYTPYCNLVHGQKCEHCNLRCLHPNNSMLRTQHLKACPGLKTELQEIHARYDCSICKEEIYTKKRKFGMLPYCNHVFCKDCICSWRQSQTPQLDTISKKSRLKCPVCRVTGLFVIPTDWWPSTPEQKWEIIEQFKAQRANIKCKHFLKGSCPFQTDCLYKH